MPWRSMERKESRYEEVDPSFSAASSVVPFVTAFDGAEIQMLKKIFRRDSGRSEVRPSGEMTIEDRGSAEMPSFPGRDSSAVSGTARSAAARPAFRGWSLFLAPFAFARKLFGIEDDDFSFSIGRKRGHHPSVRCARTCTTSTRSVLARWWVTARSAFVPSTSIAI
jgi:hypothetical protein